MVAVSSQPGLNLVYFIFSNALVDNTIVHKNTDVRCQIQPENSHLHKSTKYFTEYRSMYQPNLRLKHKIILTQG